MKQLVLILSMSFFITQINAQYFELGGSVGISNYLGDIAPSSIVLSLGESHLSAGVFTRYNFNNYFAVRGSVSFGRIGASDASGGGDEYREARNLSFRTDIYEAALIGEWNIFGFQPYVKERPFSPYVFGGIAVFQFNPQTNFEGQWHDLQPLGTEGQGLTGNPDRYKRIQVSVPLGGGLKYAISQNITIGGEIGLRKTFTDYLDDTSSFYPDLVELAETNGQLAAELSWRSDDLDPEANAPFPGEGRGDPSDLDWYIFTGVSLSYNFFNYANGRGGRGMSKIKCFSF